MASHLTRVVIVGNGIAGLTAADTLRSHGFDGDLTIVGNEGCPAYSRPALSKALLREDEHLTAHELPAPTHGADERLGVGVVRLEPSTRRLDLVFALRTGRARSVRGGGHVLAGRTPASGGRGVAPQ